MKSIVRMICRFVIVSLVFVSFQSTAGMIGTDQVATAHNERTQIHSVLARADVSSQLQAMGVDSKTAHDRVAALTDDEARSLAGKLNSVPAAAGDGWWILALIIIGVIVWWRWR